MLRSCMPSRSKFSKKTLKLLSAQFHFDFWKQLRDLLKASAGFILLKPTDEVHTSAVGTTKCCCRRSQLWIVGASCSGPSGEVHSKLRRRLRRGVANSCRAAVPLLAPVDSATLYLGVPSNRPPVHAHRVERNCGSWYAQPKSPHCRPLWRSRPETVRRRKFGATVDNRSSVQHTCATL